MDRDFAAAKMFLQMEGKGSQNIKGHTAAPGLYDRKLTSRSEGIAGGDD
jgi:hypothetical protein